MPDPAFPNEFCACPMSFVGMCFNTFWCLIILTHGYCKRHTQERRYLCCETVTFGGQLGVGVHRRLLKWRRLIDTLTKLVKVSALIQE